MASTATAATAFQPRIIFLPDRTPRLRPTRAILAEAARLQTADASAPICINAGQRRGTMPILNNKIVLVTGAGNGIGRAIVLAMAAEGATIAAADLELAAAQRTADQAAGNARRALAIEADCGDVASIDVMVTRAVAELG